MPQIQIYDVMRRAHTITSNDRETISRWLGEMVELLAPQANAYNVSLEIHFWPMFDADGKPDWITHAPTITQRYTLDQPGLQALLDDLRKAGIDVPETTGATA